MHREEKKGRGGVCNVALKVGRGGVQPAWGVRQRKWVRGWEGQSGLLYMHLAPFNHFVLGLWYCSR